MIDRLDAVGHVAVPSDATGAHKLTGRVLLAEDGVDNQRLIGLHLRKAGATVSIADNGLIALRMLDAAAGEGRPFDLLLTDMQMPEMDGYTLARTLRRRGSRLAIMALTAHAMAEDRDKCLEAGCDDYATKPIEPAKLIATCAEWMGKVGGGAEIEERR
jgi:CheY-like chemotaxis protein